MSRIDQDTVERLIEEVSRWPEKFAGQLSTYDQRISTETELRVFRTENETLRRTIASVEFHSKDERARDLDAQEANIKAIKQLEFDKGYAQAYTEVTRGMKL